MGIFPGASEYVGTWPQKSKRPLQREAGRRAKAARKIALPSPGEGLIGGAVNGSQTTSSETREKWWKNPQGIVATATIAAMVLGFFYVREKQMWEMSSRILALENRGDNAITRADARLAAIEQVLSALRDQVNFLERKIDRVEAKLAEQERQESHRPSQYQP